VTQQHASVVQQMRAYAPRGAMLRQDSRTVQPNDVFVAFSGGQQDGRHFIDAAFKSGASAVLAEASDFLVKSPRMITVTGLKQALGSIAHDYYGKPSQQLHCVGVTGTNGKTTVTHWLAQILEQLQAKPSALLGTLGAGLLGQTQATGLTTPHASDVQRFLASALSHGAGSACIEATSIGMDEGRLNSVAFTVAAFTNLTQDHLDYHATMAAYGAAKQQLFLTDTLQCAVINTDDTFGQSLLTSLAVQRPSLKCISTGRGEKSQLRATDLKLLGHGVQSFTLHYQGESYPAQLPALGDFNVDNALTVMGCCLALGFSAAASIACLPSLQGVAGRMQIVGNTHTQPLTVVDFAHTPDGLTKALQALQPLAGARGGALHVLFGCGGNRDASKRPLMGAIAQHYADHVMVSNDNPRDEDPALIAAQIVASAPKAHVQLDRALAIRRVLSSAKAADVVLIAGKGHETAQIIAGVVHAFSDTEHAQAALSTWQASAGGTA
jgi:UDP-N-acetylmuramoyl-L-alanyl-D-glutamate--2,6-diaminopimelate ligase